MGTISLLYIRCHMGRCVKFEFDDIKLLYTNNDSERRWLIILVGMFYGIIDNNVINFIIKHYKCFFYLFFSIIL